MSRRNPESRLRRPTRNEILAAAAAFTLSTVGAVGITQLNGDNDHPNGETTPQSFQEKNPDIIIEPTSVPLGPLQPSAENKPNR